ncbi:hypothetical protein [Sinomonas soli]
MDPLIEFAAAHPELERVAWIDHRLVGGEDPGLGLTFQTIAEEAPAAAGVDALLLVPVPDTGATVRDVDRIGAFLAGFPDPGPVPVDEDLDWEDPAPAAAAVAAEPVDPFEDDAPAWAAPDLVPAAAAADPFADDEDDFVATPKAAVAPPAPDDDEDDFVAVAKKTVPVPSYSEDDPFF